jgi:hemolysin III
MPVETEQKPSMRGVLHQYGFFLSLLVGPFLIVQGKNSQEMTVLGIYVLTLLALLGTSALYHRLDWSPTNRKRMRKLDHTMIFVFIAGSYTPFGVLGFTSSRNTFVLSTLWIAVLIGFFVNMIWENAPKWVSASLYLGVGWLVAIMSPEFMLHTGAACTYLMLFGGVLYSIGAIFYATKRPNPLPNVFGYHEMFHGCVLLGALAHYSSIYTFILQNA